MDILLSSFCKKYIDKFNLISITSFRKFFEIEDEVILNFYNFDID